MSNKRRENRLQYGTSFPDRDLGSAEPVRSMGRSQEFALGVDHAKPKVDWVYEGEPLESNYLRNRYGDDE